MPGPLRDWVVALVDEAGNLISPANPLDVSAGGGGGGASHVDDDPFVPGTGAVAPAGYLVDDTAPDSADEGDVAVARMSPDRIVYGRVQDGHDVAAGATTDAAVTSDAAGTRNSFLRGLVTILASVWDSVNGRLVVDGSEVTQPVSGAVSVSGAIDTELPAAILGAEGMANPTAPFVIAANSLWNGSSWDRQAGHPNSIGIIGSGARTVSVNSPSQINTNRSGIIFFLSVTVAPAVPGVGGLKLLIQIFNSVTSTWVTVNSGQVVVNSVGDFAWVLYPGAGAAPQSQIMEAVSMPLPRTFRIRVEHLDAQSYTYSVSANPCG